MIREFSQKNSVWTLAFLVAGLEPIDQKVIDYCVKRRPKTLLEKLVKGSVIELHNFLKSNREIMDKAGETNVNNFLYS